MEIAHLKMHPGEYGTLKVLKMGGSGNSIFISKYKYNTILYTKLE